LFSSNGVFIFTLIQDPQLFCGKEDKVPFEASTGFIARGESVLGGKPRMSLPLWRVEDYLTVFTGLVSFIKNIKP